MSRRITTLRRRRPTDPAIPGLPVEPRQPSQPGLLPDPDTPQIGGPGPKKYILGFKGTELKPTARALSDLNSDFALTIGSLFPVGSSEFLRDIPRFAEAERLLRNISADFPEGDLTVTGHSLGGSLAMWATGQVGTDKYNVFNPFVGIDPTILSTVASFLTSEIGPGGTPGAGIGTGAGGPKLLGITDDIAQSWFDFWDRVTDFFEPLQNVLSREKGRVHHIEGDPISSTAEDIAGRINLQQYRWGPLSFINLAPGIDIPFSPRAHDMHNFVSEDFTINFRQQVPDEPDFDEMADEGGLDPDDITDISDQFPKQPAPGGVPPPFGNTGGVRPGSGILG